MRLDFYVDRLLTGPKAGDLPGEQPTKCELVSSDGETRRFCPGDVPLCDDLSGEGHATRAITDMAAAFGYRTTS